MANTIIRPARKPLPNTGVDRYTFFELKEDTAEGLKYGQAYTLPGTVEIAPTDSGGSDTFDADNGAYIVETYLENMGHEITNADIPPAIDAMWRGLERLNGAVVVDGTSRLLYFGVAWRVLKPDGSYRYIKYFKGTYSFASNSGAKTKPSSGTSEKKTAQATYTAVKTDYGSAATPNGLMYMMIDEADALAIKGTGNTPLYANRAAFEEVWFGDMATLTADGGASDANITIVEE